MLEDLQGLRLPPGDLEDLRGCRPGACGVKVSDEEITTVQGAIADAGRDWKPALEQTFKHIMVARLRAFKAQGHAGLRPYHDKWDRVGPEQEFRAVVANAGFLQGTPGLQEYLVRYPRSHTRRFREFFYWSLESLGRKPITSVTRVTILLPEADAGTEAIVLTTQVFATHYVTASISMMAITSDAQFQPGLFVYTNYSRIDGLQGLFGGLVRRTVEGRIRSDGPAVLQELRRRLELSGK